MWTQISFQLACAPTSAPHYQSLFHCDKYVPGTRNVVTAAPVLAKNHEHHAAALVFPNMQMGQPPCACDVQTVAGGSLVSCISALLTPDVQFPAVVEGKTPEPGSGAAQTADRTAMGMMHGGRAHPADDTCGEM